MSKYLIIDGNNLLFRCFWSAYKTWHETKPAMYGVYMIHVLASYIKLFEPTETIVAWDERKGDEVNERKEILAGYKANREHNNEVYEYIDQIREIYDSLGVRQIYPLNREADDIMFWLCAYKYPNESVLITADTDMYQLIGDNLQGNIIYNPIKKQIINDFFLRDNYDVNNGREFIIKKALRGDRADNIFGIRGIRSTKIQNILALVGESKEQTMENIKNSNLLTAEEYDVFARNMELMNLEQILLHPNEIAFYEEQLKTELHPDKEKFKKILKDLNYTSMRKKCNSWFARYTKTDDPYQNALKTLKKGL